MSIINDTGIDTAKLADMIDKHLGGAFEITETKANTAFDSKDTYGSNLQRPASKGLSILGTRRIDSFRQHATRLIDQEVARAEEAAGKLNQSAVPATFYSALSVEVGKSTTKSASADSWKQQIKGLIAKGVVKEKEVSPSRHGARVPDSRRQQGRCSAPKRYAGLPRSGRRASPAGCTFGPLPRRNGRTRGQGV